MVAGFETRPYLATLTRRLAELLAPAEIGFDHLGAEGRRPGAAATTERWATCCPSRLAHGKVPAWTAI